MFALKVAIRYLLSKKSRSAINIISIISVLGVAIATSAIVCVLSVFNGFRGLAESHVSSIAPQLKVESKHGKVIENADSIKELIKTVEEIDDVTFLIEEQALALFNGFQMPVNIMGVDENFSKVTGFDDSIIDGTYLRQDSIFSFATLSVGVASRLGARPGFSQYIGIYTPKRMGRINIANPMTAFRSDSLIVCGVFETDHVDYDAETIVIPLETARGLLDYEKEVTALGISLKRGSKIEKAISDAQEKIGGDYSVKDRTQQHSNSFKMIEVEKWITFLLLLFILIISSFNVISALSMIVVEKESNIKTMKSLGASKRLISRIFLLQGWLISIAGGVVGILFGLILCLIQQHFGLIKLSGDDSMLVVKAYPVIVEFKDIVFTFIAVVVVGWITSHVTSLFTRQRY